MSTNNTHTHNTQVPTFIKGIVEILHSILHKNFFKEGVNGSVITYEQTPFHLMQYETFL